MNIKNIVPRAHETQDPLTPNETHELLKYGVLFPNISEPSYVGDDDEQGYVGHAITDEHRLITTPFESVSIKGECSVPVELVRGWSQDATDSAIASTRFYVSDFVYRKGHTAS